MKRAVSVSIIAVGVFLTACSDNPAPPGQQFIAIVDAGSSGSRLYLYQAEPGTETPQLKVLMTNRDATKPLSWFDGSNAPASDAGPQGIGPLLSALDAYLGDRGLAKGQVTVHALGTAGMRLLSDNQSQSIYNSVARTISQTGYRTGRTETISGQMEGAYSWVDVNYLLGNFRAGQPTSGIVEVGGASAQVAFAVRESTPTGTLSFRINGAVFPVLTVSYLGLGQNEARRAMIENPASGGTERNVCYPQSNDSDRTQYDSGFAAISVRAVSSSYGASCAQVYQSVIQKVTDASPGAVAFNQLVRMPELQSTRFVGISSIYFAFNDWKVLDAANAAESLRDKVTQACTGPDAWERVRAQYGGSTSAFAQNACANATFIHTWLFGGSSLRLPPRQLSVVPSIEGQELSWTRGAALLEALNR